MLAAVPQFLDKLSSKLDKLDLDKMGARASRLKESIAYSWNPDHRHDEEHERVEDRARAAICDSHRFGSFADVQAGNDLKW